METLTFGEQVKIILSRKGMTIKELAEKIEERTGKAMSRQNLTQRLGRDNFQEQDMRMIASILECPFHLSIFPMEAAVQAASPAETASLNPEEARILQSKRAKKGQASEQTSAERAEEAEARRAAEEEAARKAAEEEEAARKAADEEEAARKAAEEEEAARKAAEEEEAARKAAEEEEAVIRTAAEEEESADEVEEIVPTAAEERDMTIGELVGVHKELDEIEEIVRAEEAEAEQEDTKEEKPAKKEKFRTGGIFLRRKGTPSEDKKETQKKKKEPIPSSSPDFEPVIKHKDIEEDREAGEINPYTGREYQSNSVRMHPSRIGYVQVYDRAQHGWTDMTEWAFLGYQERKKALMGKDYEPPIYLD